MKMKDYNLKDHPEYFEKFDHSAWKKINDNLENLSFDEFQAIMAEDRKKTLEEYDEDVNNK